MTGKNPEVSIITPLFNGAAFIGQAVGSVVNQTFPDWEMIIVDDGSSDHPETVLAPFLERDKRIRLIRMDHNVGAAEARNVALEAAKGDFVAFLDGDDLWQPLKLERQLSLMKENEWAFSFTSYEIIRQDGQPSGKIIRAPRDMDYPRYLKNTVIGCLTVMIDRRKTGPFKMHSIPTSHDMALWLELMKRGFNAHGIDEVLASYRTVSTSNSANKLKAAMGVWRVYREIEKLKILPGLYYFTGYACNAVWRRL
jgi:teichuronic acid biosynthesis glycosyltransferase TuaG